MTSHALREHGRTYAGADYCYDGYNDDALRAAIGGAIHAASSSTLTMTSCTLSGNTVKFYHDDGIPGGDAIGGAIYALGPDDDFVHALWQRRLDVAYSLSANSVNGGAICVESSSTLTMTSCTLSGNTADSGGAIYMTTSTLVAIDGISFNNNTADSGAALFTTGSGDARPFLSGNSLTDLYGTVTCKAHARLGEYGVFLGTPRRRTLRRRRTTIALLFPTSIRLPLLRR